MLRPLSAGSIVESRCTRCREVLNHTIVAMVGDQIVRVECNTCHSVHNHHPVKQAKEPAAKAPQRKAATPRPAKVDPVAAAAAEWESLRSGMDPAQAIPYAMNGSFRANSLISHPQFGLGIVQQVQPGKIDVLFRDGKRLLRCS